MSKDYYSILGVGKNASQDEIKAAFRKKAHEHHPDKGGDQAKFKELNEAYQVLGNPEKKARYDQFGSGFEHGQAGAGGFDFGGFGGGGFNINLDDLGDVFGDFFTGGGSKKSKKRGRDMEVAVEIDFIESIFGVTKEITLNKQNDCKKCSGSGIAPDSKTNKCTTCNGRGQVAHNQRTVFGTIQMQSACPTCQGEGETHTKLCEYCKGKGFEKSSIDLDIKIPAGIQNGQSIRLAGQGEAGGRGGANGDLYIHVRVKNHKKFSRSEDNIITKEEITYSQAVLGDTINIETVYGQAELKIPSGTQSGTILKIKNKGAINLRSGKSGDHLAEIIVKIPEHLSWGQKKIIKELKESGL